jgi:cation/acetate symporter
MVPAIFISLQLTGNPIPQLGFGSTVSDGTYLLDKVDGLLTDLGFNAYTNGSKSTIDIFFITAALMVGTAGLPHVIVRFFTVPKVRDARKSAGYALAFIAILYTTAPALGAFGIYNMVNNINGKEISALPSWIENWKKTGLVNIEDKDGDGKVLYHSDPSKNELTMDKDIMVLANPEIAGLPNWVIALVAAGGLAAALSTAAGLLLVISTAISRDLLKNALAPNISEKNELIYARLAAVFAVVVAGYFGINPPGFVAQVVAFAFGLAASSFFPIIIMGIFSKRMNKEGAIAGMIVGLLFTLGYIIYFKFLNPASNTPENWWFGISPEGIGTLGMLFNFLVAFAVSRFTPAPPTHIQELVEDIRIPRGAGTAHDH